MAQCPCRLQRLPTNSVRGFCWWQSLALTVPSSQKSYKNLTNNSKATMTSPLLHTISHRTHWHTTRWHTRGRHCLLLSRGPGTSRSFGLCGPGSPLWWSPVSRPAGPCSPGSQQRWSPERRQCCSPVTTARLGTGLGSPPSRAQWWGWEHPRCPTAASAWGTGRHCSPGRWSRRWCWHNPGCKQTAGRSS